MAWPDVPSGWITTWATEATSKPPTVEVRVLDEGEGWNVVTAETGVKLISHDPIEQCIDWFAFGGVNKSKETRFTFSVTHATDATGRNDYFDNDQGNVAAGMPLLCRISFDGGTTYRTIYSGVVTFVEEVDIGLVEVTTRWHFDWWLENRACEEYWALTASPYVTKTPIAVAEGARGSGAFILNNQAADAEKFTDANKISVDYNWPATYHVWAKGGIPSSFMTGGAHAGRVCELGSSSAAADYKDWGAALSIYTRPKDFSTGKWMTNNAYDGTFGNAAVGLNWVGAAKHPGVDGGSDPEWLHSIYPPHGIYGGYRNAGGADHPFTLDDEDGARITTGAAILCAPDPDEWTEDRMPDRLIGSRFCWSPWSHPKGSLANFTIIRQDGDSQDNESPSPDYCGYNSIAAQQGIYVPEMMPDEQNCTLVGDAREGTQSSLGSEANPWFKVCYCPPQGQLRGWSSLKVQDSDEQQNTRRSEIINVIRGIIHVLGGYERPPIPEIDGATEYDLQDAFFAEAAGGGTDGYVQTTGSAATIYSATSDVPGRFIEDESRIPLLQDYFLHFHSGVAEDVLKPGATFKSVLEELCKVAGLYVYASPFGQLDFDIVRPLDNGDGGFWDSGTTTVPKFRASLSADEPNTGEDTERNAWDLRWKDRSDKQARSVTIESQLIDTDLNGGTTELYGVSVSLSSEDAPTILKGKNDLKFSTRALFGRTQGGAPSSLYRASRAYGDTLGEAEWSAPLRYYSDDVTRDDTTGLFLRIGRPCAVYDTQMDRAENVVLTRIAIDAISGTMRLLGVHSDNGPTDENCYANVLEKDYGNVGVGSYSDFTVTITNDSGSNITGNITLNAGGEQRPFEIESGAAYVNLTPGSSHDCVVRFHPPTAGAHYEFLDLGNGCGVDGQNHKVFLHGVGIEIPIAVIEPPLVNFWTWYEGMTLEKRVRLTNYGWGTLTGTYKLDSARSEHENSFHIYNASGEEEYEADEDINIGGGAGLGHLESDEIIVRMRPATADLDGETVELSAVVTFDANVTVQAAGHPDELHLEGIGMPLPDCLVYPHSANFDYVMQGSAANRQITLSNTSQNSIWGKAIIHQAESGPFEFDDGAGEAYSVASPDNGTTVSAVGDGSYNYNIPPGGATITWNLRFEPTTSHRPGAWNASVVFDGSRDCLDVTALGVAVAQDGPCIVSSTSANWGRVASGEEPDDETITLTNKVGRYMTGTASITQTASAFAIESGGTMVSEDAIGFDDTHDVVVSYTPTGNGQLDVGYLTFAMTSAEHVNECLTVVLMGQGLSDEEMTQTDIDFGEVEVGITAKRNFEVINSIAFTEEQGYNLSVTVGGSDYSLINPATGSAVSGYTLNEFFAAPCAHSIVLRWLPSSSGSGNGILYIKRYDEGYSNVQHTRSVDIKGVAYESPACEVSSGAMLFFGAGPVGSPLPSQNFVLTVGGGPSGYEWVITPSKMGTDAADFNISYGTTGSGSGSGPFTLEAGETITGTVTATPGAPGFRSAGVAFDDGCNAVVGLHCFGEAGKAEYVTWSPNQLAMTADAADSDTVTIVQRNTSLAQDVEGTATLEGSTFTFETPIASSGDSSATKVHDRKYTYTLAAGDTISWGVTFSPLAVTDYRADINFTGDVTYTVLVVASCIATRSSKRPDEVPGMVAWFHTDYDHGWSDTDSVGTWADQSGLGNDATQATSSKKPTYQDAELNGYGVLEFDGTDDHLTLGDIELYDNADGFTIIAVVKWAGTGEESITAKWSSSGDNREWRLYCDDWGIWEDGDTDTGYGFATYTLGTGSFKTVSAWWATGGLAKIRVNEGSTQESTGTPTDMDGTCTNDMFIGAGRHIYGAEAFTGQIAEIIYYDRDLTSDELGWVENWLQAKYSHY